MKKIVDNKTLDDILTEVCFSPDHYYNISSSYFSDLYYTGCRSHEPLQIERWSYKNEKIELRTMKTNAIRKFDPTRLSNELLIAIAENRAPYYGLTYQQLTLEFRKLVRMHPIYAGDRIADTYLFRYNRARQMFENTNSITEVMLFFQWNSEQICNNYITRPLIYEPFNRLKL